MPVIDILDFDESYILNILQLRETYNTHVNIVQNMYLFNKALQEDALLGKTRSNRSSNGIWNKNSINWTVHLTLSGLLNVEFELDLPCNQNE